MVAISRDERLRNLEKKPADRSLPQPGGIIVIGRFGHPLYHSYAGRRRGVFRRGRNVHVTINFACGFP
ncbi:MAG: hypothetical protein E5W78_03140, partial [Mesorhizobium sp.]